MPRADRASSWTAVLRISCLAVFKMRRDRQSRANKMAVNALVVVHTILLIPQVNGYSQIHLLPHVTRRCSVSSVTALHGFRSSIRDTFSSLQWKAGRRKNIAEYSPSEGSAMAVASEAIPTRGPTHVSVVDTIAPLVDVNNQPLYTLPPLGDRNLTKLELEFRNMIADFAHFTPHDIESLRDPRMRVLFEGVAASAGCPPVYRAFEVLYEDLYPLRVAGRMVYARLKQLMIDSQMERDRDVALIAQKTELPKDDIEATRLSFVSVAARLNGDAFLTKEQLRETGLSNIAQQVLGFESLDDLLQYVCKDTVSDKITYTDMMLGLEEATQNVCGMERCNPAEVMRGITAELMEHPPTVRRKLDSKRQQYSDHYDAMLAAFQEWESLVPQGEGRRLDIVRGCFVGAKNKPVVEALRIVYVDYAALRVAGDIIFKLVKGVMSAAANRQKRLSK